jgi:hypothetical protein
MRIKCPVGVLVGVKTKSDLVVMPSGRQCLTGAFAICAAVVFAAGTATAQDTINVGFVLPMTGQLTSVGTPVLVARAQTH